jgi:hypothetical protein
VRSLLLIGFLAATLSPGTPLHAQTATGSPDGAAPVAPQSGPIGTMLPEDIAGRDIVDITGANVGAISDIIVDSQGNPTLLMVDVGGFLGIGTRTVALDPSTITFEQQGDLLTSLTKDQIELLPAYEQGGGGWQLKP